jgi:hypothetical protein
MALLEAAAGAAGKAIFKRLLLSVYDYVESYTTRSLADWRTQRHIDTLYKRIADTRRVKTIWQVDKAVDLTSLYCDSHVVIGDKRKRILRVADFGAEENIVIQGIAGQGKSILLRYLCSNELSRGEYIPVFLELRRITGTTSLMDRIEHACLALGLDIDSRLFNALARSGRLLLLLDAYDEIADDLKPPARTSY